MGEDAGLATAGACEDENGTIGVGNSLALNVTKGVGFDNHHPMLFAIGARRASNRRYLASRTTFPSKRAIASALERYASVDSAPMFALAPPTPSPSRPPPPDVIDAPSVFAP